MRAAVFLLLALAAAIARHTAFAGWLWAPDPSLAMLAWSVVAGGDRFYLLRALAIGALADCADPVPDLFHTVVCLGLAAGFLLVRRHVFRARATSWMVVGAVFSILAQWADWSWSGRGDRSWIGLLLEALTTGLLAGGLGWLAGGLPPMLRPWREAGA